MKLRLIKHSIIVAALSSVIPFVAAHADDSGQWQFNLSTFYAQGNGLDAPFGTYSTMSYSSSGDSQAYGYENSFDQSKPKNNFGYQIGLGYMFNSRQDIQLGWTHFNSDATTTASHQGSTLADGSAGAQFSTMAGQKFGLWAGDYVNESSQNTFKHDAIDATFGQSFIIGPRFQARFFGGIRAAQVSSGITTTYDAVMNAGFPLHEVDTFKSTMKGVGPQIGMTGKLKVISCLGLNTHVAVMSLVGNSTASYSANRDFYDGGVIVNGSGDYNTGMKVIPGYDLKMGLSCGIPLDNNSSIDLEAGYSITQYIGGLTQYTLAGDARTAAINATVSGPYFNLGYRF